MNANLEPNPNTDQGGFQQEPRRRIAALRGNIHENVITQNLDRLTWEHAIEKKAKAADERRAEAPAYKRDKARRSAEKNMVAV